jgi:hypothetical protein
MIDFPQNFPDSRVGAVELALSSDLACKVSLRLLGGVTSSRYMPSLWHDIEFPELVDAI